MPKEISTICRGIAWGDISLAVLDTTALVNEAIRRHRLSPVAAAALGRTFTAAAYLCSWLKSEESTLSVSVAGGRPRRQDLRLGATERCTCAVLSNIPTLSFRRGRTENWMWAAWSGGTARSPSCGMTAKNSPSWARARSSRGRSQRTFPPIFITANNGRPPSHWAYASGKRGPASARAASFCSPSRARGRNTSSARRKRSKNTLRSPASSKKRG